MNRRTDDFRRDSQKSPSELEREIDATRAELEATLEELEHRLSPTDIMSNVMSRIRREGGELAENLGHSVKENPLPMLLTSVGIAWMMASSARHNGHHAHHARHSTRSRMREAAEGLGERWREAKSSMRHGKESAREGMEHAREGLGHARDVISGSASSARQRGRELSARVRRRTMRARSGLEHLWHEQPLMLGVLGFAAGAIAGAAFPSTEQEDEMLGPLRDRAFERAKARGARGARELRERAEHLAEEAKNSMSDGGSTGDGDLAHGRSERPPSEGGGSARPEHHHS